MVWVRREIISAGILFLILIPVVFVISGCRESGYGIEFETLETGTNTSIRAMHVVNENIIWASGTEGRYLISTDAGLSWVSDTVPGASGDDFRSIYAWDGSEAILFGIQNPGTGYYTSDGGKSWDVVYRDTTPGIFFNSLMFADEDHGIALSDPVDSCSFVLLTENRGRTWKSIKGLPVLYEGEYNFAASNSCIDYHDDGRAWIITGGNAARVMVSEDNGDSWEVFNTGLVHGNASSGNFSVSFYDNKNGIVVGGTYDKPELNEDIAAWSSDGGRTWHLSEKMPREFRSCVIWLDNNSNKIAFAIGKTGCDYSIDNGVTWIPGNDEKGYYTARPVPGELTGYAAGSDGKIAKFRLKEIREE